MGMDIHEQNPPGLEMARIELADIDISGDSPLRIRRHLPGDEGQSESDKELTASVTSSGLIQPPLLMSGGRPGNKNTYTPVYGHRRLAAAAEAGHSRVYALFVPPGLPEGRILALRAAELEYGGPLTGLEKIIALDKIVKFMERDIEMILPALSSVAGQKLTAARLKKLLSLLDLGRDTLEALHDGKVTAGDLLALEGHPLVDTNRAVSLLSREELTRGTAKEAVRLLLYLADQGGGRIERFLEERGPDGTPAVKRLRAACYPSLDRDMKEFSSVVEEIGLPTEASVNHPPNFEGGSLKLSITIRDEGSLSRVLEKLETALDKGLFGRLIEILSGKRK